MAFNSVHTLFIGSYLFGMYRSTNNGDLWEPFNNGLPFDKLSPDARGNSVDRITFMNFYLYCIIYFFGAYMIPINLDASDTWLPVNGGLPNDPTTTDLTGAPINMLYLAASNQGLFRNIYPVGVQVNSGENTCTVSISPNPVHGNATFTVHLVQPQRLSLTIWNTQGISCGTVFQGFLSEGTTNLPWETCSLSSGLYTYRLIGEKSVTTGKLIIP